MRLNKNALIAAFVAIDVIIADQILKWVVLDQLGLQLGETIDLGPVFDLTYVLNTGVSFGLLGGGEARWFLTVFSLLVAGAMAWWAASAPRKLMALALGLVIGGALGNAIDRIRIGAVIDFLDFSALHFPWIFNIADAAISVGVALLVLDSLLSDRKPAVGSASQKE